MPRYILIDNFSGYVFCDTADMAQSVAAEWRDGDQTPQLACELFDRSIGEHGRTYVADGRLNSNQTGYHVYRADIDGSEAVPVVTDGQDQDQIEAVTKYCRYVEAVRCVSAESVEI